MKFKSIKSIICVVLITILIVSLLSNINSFTVIEDACVNTENGDISIAYYVPSAGGIKIKSYDFEGNLLFDTFVDSDGGTSVYLAYNSSLLNVYVSRADSLSAFNRDGEKVKNINDPNKENVFIENLRKNTWKDWKSEKGNKIYSFDGQLYVYEEANFYERVIKKGWAKLYILGVDDEKTVLYESRS